MKREEVRAARKAFASLQQSVAGAAVLAVISVCDRAGLFKAMSGAGPLSPEELTAQSGLDERYVQEALRCLAAAGLLTFHGKDGTFELPSAVAAVLADEDNPYFMGGWGQLITSIFTVVPEVATAMREGGGVPFSHFGPDFVDGMHRSSAPGVQLLLTSKWLPSAIPGVVDGLQTKRLKVVDVGCGCGAATIAMAQAYPHSKFLGIDVDKESIRIARKNAKQAGVLNTSFRVMSASKLPMESFDLATAFDVIHDLAAPLQCLTAIKNSLRADGVFLMVEPDISGSFEETMRDGPNMDAARLYAISMMHCMTQSLASGGPGLGAAWGPAAAADLCSSAGFVEFRTSFSNGFNSFYTMQRRKSAL